MCFGKLLKKRWLQAFLVIVILITGWLWWRMGSIEVVLNETLLKTLPTTGDTAEFTIMTYNVQARPLFDDSKQKFKFISPLMNAYDICAFQECFKDHHLLWEATEHPVKLYHATLKHPFKVVGSGLSILGKFPLEKTDGINFDSQGDGQNRPASKGVLMARFLVQGMPVDVYTTHIAAGKHEASMRAKFEQSDEIIRFINQTSPPENAVILLGDFNMRPSRGPEDREANKNNPKVMGFDYLVKGLNLRDASDEINGPVGTEIDRILFRPGNGQTMTPLRWQHDGPEFYGPDGEPLSDHEPVIVKFKLEKKVVAEDSGKALRTLAYSRRNADAAAAWQEQVRQELTTLLHLDASLAARTAWPLDVTEVSAEDKMDYIQREVTFNATPKQRINAIVTLPADTSAAPFPAVVCIHGHGGTRHTVYDKDTNYHGFATTLAAKGFVTIAVDVGQHDLRDPKATLMGERLFDLIRSVDYLETLPEVDPKRIGCAGLSLGGEMAMWLGAMDTRICATVSAGFLTVMDQMEQNHCMCWKFDGLRERVDFADIYSLIAPRALLCQIGEQEPPTQFTPTLAKSAFSELQVIYEDMGVPDKAELYIHPGAHEIHLDTLVSFFEKYLAPES